jgi:predicted TIM-barrel fold metal-dependent hydrolase
LRPSGPLADFLPRSDARNSTMQVIWEAFFSITKDFTAEERDKLFAANAIRHYRLAI